MIKGVENKAQEESLRDWDMFSLEKRRQKGDIITLDNCIRGVTKRTETNCSH